MAVKKATAKKSMAKKAAAKKTAKKSTLKKATSKASKKSVVKKSAVKKSAVKSTRKKAVVKKSPVKKAAARKSTAKKATKRIAPKKSPETIVIPEAPIPAPRNARVEIVSTPAPAPVIIPAAPSSVVAAPTSEKKPGASGRVIFAVAVGIILLGLIVWAKGQNSNSDNKALPTPTATTSTSTTPSASPTPSASDTSATLTAHEAPQGVVAHYTSTGATIFWKAPTAVDGLTGYNVEISVSNGPWKLISTVPVAQTTLDVKKENTSGWTSFKVSSVYSDSQTVAAKAFGLPGTYS